MVVIKSQYLQIQSRVKEIAIEHGRDPNSITLIAVTKAHSVEDIRTLYDLGCRNFGENRVDVALGKMNQLPTDIKWHMIGSLQKNKVRKAIGKFELIHSVDTPELAKKISECSMEAGLKTRVLLQANTSGEESKQGLIENEWKIRFEEVQNLAGLQIEGMMNMAPLINDEKVIKNCFAKLRRLAESLGLKELSMGMSQDYPIAIAEGATLLRLGTALWCD